MTEALRYVVYGELTSESPNILAMSAGVSREEAARWRQYISIAPMKVASINSANHAQSIGLFKGPGDDYILARAYNYTQETAIYQGVYLPRSLIKMMTGYLPTLIESTEHPLPVTHQDDLLEPLPAPDVPTMVSNIRLDLFNTLMKRHGIGISTLLMLLDAILAQQALTICGFIPDVHARLKFAEGLIMLLPASVQPELTFCTQVEAGSESRALVVFSDESATNGHNPNGRYLWSASETHIENFTPRHPYVQYLSQFWRSDLKAFSVALQRVDNMAADWVVRDDLAESLAQLTQKNLNRAQFSAEDWKKFLQRQAFQVNELSMAEIDRLLLLCLDERDTEIVMQLLTIMADYPSIDEYIREKLTALLEYEPDAVYFFVRTRLAGEMDEVWLPRLHAAAVAALKFAIHDGDNETLMNWFKLIAREPGSYALGEILQGGIIAAQPRTHEDGNLGRRLIAFVMKRRPQLVDLLVDDPEVVAALNAPLGPALREFTPASVAAAAELNRELALIVLGRAAEKVATNDNAAAAFTATQINYIWSLVNAEALENVPTYYNPTTIMDMLIENGVGRLSNGALGAMMSNIIATDDKARLSYFAKQLANATALTPILTAVYREMDLPDEKILDITNFLMTNQILLYQRGADIYLRLVANRDWEADTMPFVEQAARLIQKQGVVVPVDTLWDMLALASRTDSEFVGRVVTRQILVFAGEQTDESTVIDIMMALRERLSWSQSAEATVIMWWREFVHSQPIARLQQFKALLDGQRSLGELASVVQTTIAMRRMLSKGSIEDFAEAVNTTFSLLQAISDSFDPVNKQTLRFDEATVRTEMEALDGKLTLDERSVLAKNLKELAQLIIDMSDHRSKASLMRREEDIERGLLTGEQQPQSAIDTMKWMSGYLNGSQASEEDNDA